MNKFRSDHERKLQNAISTREGNTMRVFVNGVE